MGFFGFGNVVSMGMRKDAVNFPAVAQVDAYWEGLRDERILVTT